MFINYFRVRYLRKLRAKLRAIKYLKENNLFESVALRSYVLEQAKPNFKFSCLEKFWFLRFNVNPILVTQQYISSFLLHKNLPFNVLVDYSFGKYRDYSLPPYLFRVAYGSLPVSAYIRNYITWVFFLLFLQLKLLAFAIRSIFSMKRRSVWEKNSVSAAYFCNLTPRLIPDIKTFRLDNIFSWYSNVTSILPSTHDFCHNVNYIPSYSCEKYKVYFRSDPSTYLLTLFHLPKVICYLLVLLLFSIISIALGRWMIPLLSLELYKAFLFDCNKSKIATIKSIVKLFNGEAYRPLWSYIASDICNIPVYLVFYSTFKLPSLNLIEHVDELSWNLLNWDNYVVWNEDHQQRIKSHVRGFPTIIIPPILPLLADKQIDLDWIRGKSIMIYDIQPQRKSVYIGLKPTFRFNYCYPNARFDFLRDIVYLSSKYGFRAILKSKRFLGNKYNRKYKKFVDELCLQNLLTTVDPDVSARRTTDLAFATISYPFTSTGLLSKMSFYYDPTSLMTVDPKSIYHSKLIPGYHSLELWFSSMCD